MNDILLTFNHRIKINRKSLALLLLLFSVTTHAATTPPTEDINFLAEHLAEAAQDARYFAMPWPVGDYQDKGWKPLVSIAAARDSAGFAIADGGLLTVGVSKALNDRWAVDLLAYYDRFNVSGSSTRNVLSAFSLNGVPLDLPETALFTNPRGEFQHTGIGMIISHRINFGEAWHWDLFSGLLLEELKLINYQFDYQLTGGANAGATGFIDYSVSNKLVYGVLGLQAKKKFWNHYDIIPRLVLGFPFKNGDLPARMTGQNFDLSTESTGAKPHQIGDGFIYIGTTIQDLNSHFEMDLGAILGYEAFERLAHEGISSALIVSVTWRM